MSDSSYVIPSTQMKPFGSMKYMLVSGVLSAILLGALGKEEKIIELAFTGLIFGLLAPLPFLVIAGYIASSRHQKHTKAVWAHHTHTWYREAFPQHAHANGHVSCRHCGSHKTQVRNLMERTYMRLHSCAQCGETLYYSAEKT